MGLYVEVSHKDKWLEQNGEPLMYGDFTWESIRDDEFMVVLVNNYAFFAAGVAFNEREFGEFTRQSDERPKKYYAVKKELLKKVCPLWDDYVR